METIVHKIKKNKNNSYSYMGFRSQWVSGYYFLLVAKDENHIKIITTAPEFDQRSLLFYGTLKHLDMQKSFCGSQL